MVRFAAVVCWEVKLYAVLKHKGKQYKIKEGETVLLDKIDANPGDKLELGEVVLLRNDELILDKEKLSEAKIQATLLEEFKDKKVIAFKYKPKKGYRRKKGHRQLFSRVRIDKIVFGKEEAEKAETCLPTGRR